MKNLKNCKWLFFDIGSTIVDETLCYDKRYEELVQDTDISKDAFVDKVIELAKQNKDACRAAADFYGLQIPKWHKELEKLYPDAQSVLGELSEKYKLGIIANQSLGSQERLNAWGIGQYFDLVIASAEEGVSKPDLRIFNIALKKADCRAEDAVMIGDRLDNDIIPAKRLGMNTVWIKQGFAVYQTPEKDSEIPDFEVNSLTELLNIF